MPSRAAYISLALARSDTGCRTVLIPWVVVMSVAPSAVGGELLTASPPARSAHIRGDYGTAYGSWFGPDTGQWRRGGDGGGLGPGGRGAGAGGGAAQQRRDRGAAVRVGAHRGKPRVLAAAQAGRAGPAGVGPARVRAGAGPVPARGGPADAADAVRRPGHGAGRAGRVDQGTPAGHRGRPRR